MAAVAASFTPISSRLTPCLASGGTMPRVWPGTSVILAPVVTTPKRRVEGLRNGQTAFDHGLAEHLGLPGEGQSVPGDVTAGDCLLHGFAIGGRGLFEVFIEQPRAGGPHIAALARGICCAGNLDCLGKEFLEVSLVDDVILRIDESGVEVALEHDQYALDGGVGRGLLGVEGKRRAEQQAGSGGGGGLYKFAAFHRVISFMYRIARSLPLAAALQNHVRGGGGSASGR